MPSTYVLMNTTNSGRRVLGLANIYHNLPETRYAHPNFGIPVQQMSYNLYDYYSTHQWHIKRVIGSFNTASVWDFNGLQYPITVAVIDDGVDSHEDLPDGRILPGYDFADNETDTRPGPQLAHGMGCAGIIAASHTTDSMAGLQKYSGVLSLAPNVRVLPINIFDNLGGSAEIALLTDAITYAYTNGADILSCSWGFDSRTADFPTLTDALERATLFGRNGRGCPVIFASGNTRFFYPDPSYVRYPARLPFCFGVGATWLRDTRWDYSCFGAGLDLVAPSGDVELLGDVWTLDQMGVYGFNPLMIHDCPPGSGNDLGYDCRFGGTSAACPVVSGIAALLLSKDSTLSAQAIYHILRNSAQRDLDWGTIATVPDPEYGYGRVDAFRAVSSLCHGDADNNGTLNVSDLSYLIAYLQQGGPAPFPSAAVADVNCDGSFNISDITYIVATLPQGGPPPVKPCFTFGS